MIAIERGGEQVKVILTQHGLDRWRERVMPTASAVLAQSQLFAFLAGAHFVTRMPRWLHGERPSVAVGRRLAINPTRPRIALLVAGDGGIVSVLTADHRQRLSKIPDIKHGRDRRRP